VFRMLLQFKSHGERRNRNVLDFLKENIGKTQLIKKFIKVDASPAKHPEIKEDPGGKHCENFLIQVLMIIYC
jgi:hypothetical protein